MTDEQTQHAGLQPSESAHAAPATGTGHLRVPLKRTDQCPDGTTEDDSGTCGGGGSVKPDKGI